MLVYIYSIKVPDDLRIGIVNYETNHCQNFTIFDCQEAKFSCEVLKNFKDVVQINYETQLQAFEHFDKGKIFGIITMGANFTKSLDQFYNNYKIITDPSNFPFYGVIEYKFYTAITEVIENLSAECDLNTMTEGMSIEFINVEEKFVTYNIMTNTSVVMVLA